MLTLDGSFYEAQFRHSTLHRRCDLRGVADCEADLDLRISPSDSEQVPRQPMRGDRPARVTGERTPLPVAIFAQRELRRFGPSQYGPRLYQEDVAGLGEFNPPPDPTEQCGVVTSL